MKLFFRVMMNYRRIAWLLQEFALAEISRQAQLGRKPEPDRDYQWYRRTREVAKILGRIPV